MVFLSDGKLNLAVPNGGVETWKITEEETVIFVVKNYAPGMIHFSEDWMTFSGKADLIERKGKLIALPIGS